MSVLNVRTSPSRIGLLPSAPHFSQQARATMRWVIAMTTLQAILLLAGTMVSRAEERLPVPDR